MKTRIIIGGEVEKSEVVMKEYSSGIRVVESGDAENIINKGEKPISVEKMSLSEKEKEEVLNKPERFEISKGKLVRKDKGK